MKVWLNGEVVNSDEARISPLDRGFLLGDGLFETLLCKEGRPCNLAAHVGRMVEGAEVFVIQFPWKKVEIENAIMRLLEESELTSGKAAVRLTLSRGPGARGLDLPPTDTPTLLITCSVAPKEPEVLKLQVSSIRRNELSPASNFKTLNYADNLLARKEARSHGADEALMLNTQGFVACAAAYNVWTLNDDIVRTPSVDQGILPGTIRKLLLDLLPDVGLPVNEGPISLESLFSAQEVFVSNSLVGICPVSKVNEQRFSTTRMSDVRTILEDALWAE